MRLTDAERGPNNKMREVSDLRTQFQCEFRLHLKQKLGGSSSRASTMGSILHRLVSDQTVFHDEKNGNRLVPLFIIIVTLIAGLLWILW
ncbi:MAG: hypothetical protein ACW96M_02635 [Candidatus Thorarchaeota archaeon]|jgi:hypothetical protein